MNKNFLNDFFNLERKTVLVTGATGQLGSEICKAYDKIGARVIATDKDLNSKKMIKSDNVEYMQMDISDKNSVLETFKAIYAKFGKIDILINNAGIGVFEPFEKRTEESFDRVMDINLKGTFFCIQTYVNFLKEKGHKANIVNIASIYGIVSPDPRVYTDCDRKSSEVYGAVKAGIIQMTRYFASHLGQYNIRVNCISPGGIFNSESPQGKNFVKNYSHRCPMGRMAKAEEMIGAILYLSSDASQYTTGHNIVIDGGMSCW